jgi:hypothetical protein
MEYPVMILPEISILDVAMSHGNVHSELDGSHYLYLPFCFKYTEDKRLFIEPIENVPDNVRVVMRKFGLTPNHDQDAEMILYKKAIWALLQASTEDGREIEGFISAHRACDKQDIRIYVGEQPLGEEYKGIDVKQGKR